MNKIKIDFVISTLNRGGAENKLVAVANGLDRKKFETRVCLLKEGPLTKKLEVRYIERAIPSKYSLTGLFHLSNLFRVNRTHIVWVVGTGDAGFYGRIAARIARVPIVIQSLHATGRIDGKPTIDPLNKILDRVQFFTHRYVAVAKAHKTYLLRVEKLNPKKTTVIYNGVDVKEFKCRKPNIALRAEMGIPDNVSVIGIVARLKPEKRHTIFLDACKIVKKYNKTVHFLIVGDGPLKSEIQSYAAEIGISDRTHFSGAVDDVASYYSLMTVSTLCSNTVETFPNVVLESLACGIPVVSTDVGSVSEAVINEQTGLLVPPDDPEALAYGISRLLSDTNLRDIVVKNGRQRVTELFSLENMIEKREILFKDLLTEKGIILE